jgi:hypothetical protein
MTDIFIDVVVVLFYLVYVNYSMILLFSLLPVKTCKRTFEDSYASMQLCINELWRCLHITWLRHNLLGE